MSQQEPAVYNLEFSDDVDFWTGAGAASRRTFLMPLPDATRFVAFGVVGPGDTVLFVARGRVGAHLGAFLATLERDGARVELYARPPLPWHLVKRYTSDDPYESQETEGPKNPPVQGFVALGGGAQTGGAGLLETPPEPLSTASFSWPAEVTPSRRVIVIPASGEDDFVAFGVCGAPDRFVFVARGRVSDHLGGFSERMKLAGASLELRDAPPLPFLQAYVDQHAGALFSACACAAGTCEILTHTSAQVAARAS
ncbi:hypothetical protein [Pyxidicoccus trucidator]|uniref:hypothetical protein n=1 Tax=Pyxidicoccus trucidator TaxID=2709662 RepID=UPI0013DA6126|nr:hypothetical protein [Pyxidicoccus trucidator]